MYKLVVKVNSGSPRSSLLTFKKAGFIPLYYRKDGNREVYTALYKSNDLNELKEALVDLAYLLSREGKTGGHDFAVVYQVQDKYLGKGIGGVLGAGIGWQLGGIGGMILGLLGGLILGELIDIEMGERLVGVWGWPISIVY
ncbi:MAG: hypothetical protein MPF33_03600 [Candidatus Aramenus sp.]|jgi:hypothetical protein|nr:hypothetical protein [Candidatus Aramenus sp.]